MKVGDLIRECFRESPELGLIIEVMDLRCDRPFAILCPNGKVGWFTKTYIERCEVVSESR